MEEKDYESITGVVDHIKYKNDETGFCVCEIDSGEEIITAVGVLSFVEVGEEIKATGNWVVHPSFGRQFSVECYEKKLPTNEASILRYLSGGSIKGVGPVTASRIVDMYGDKTLEIIENEPEKLCKIKGISPNKAKKINESYKQQFGIRSVLLFLQQYGVSPSLAVKIYKKWGAGSVDVIKRNPYIICDEISGVSFMKSDEIAKQMGINKDFIFRIYAGIKFVLKFNAYTNGFTFVPECQLCEIACNLLDCTADLFDTALHGLIAAGEIVKAEIHGTKAIYLEYFYLAEEYVSKCIIGMCENKYSKIKDIEKKIDKLERDLNITYAANQREAIREALENQFMIITGGPGTGKTTALKGIIRLLEEEGQSVALAAPTGRAAKRMSELTGKEASTLHRLLEMQYGSDDRNVVFLKNEEDKLDYDTVICDEVSMLDILLAQALFKALPKASRLIFVGDADQLPPVGAGNVFSDLIGSEKAKTVFLKEIFRQANESYIVLNAHRIIKGETPDLKRKDKDFFFMRCADAKDVIKTVVDLCKTRLPRTYDYYPMWDIQVLSPSKKMRTGTGILNQYLREAINPPSPSKKEKKYRDIVFREGDKVMQIRNNYDIYWKKDNGEDGTGVFNGDIGILEKIDFDAESFTVRYEDRQAQYTFEMFNELEPAYAITVHKSQGSEFPVVILPLYEGPDALLHRKLLYTAVTRARNMLIIVGREETVYRMAKNNKQTQRFSGLKYILKSL